MGKEQACLGMLFRLRPWPSTDSAFNRSGLRTKKALKTRSPRHKCLFPKYLPVWLQILGILHF